ncbi:MAG: L,D-transpeptidase family protein [Candidatus Woesearchaeota archaeon]
MRRGKSGKAGGNTSPMIACTHRIRKDKRGAMLLYIATIALVISLFAFLTIKVLDQPSKWESKYIGEHQIAVLEASQTANQFLTFLDQSAALAAQQSAYTISQKGGLRDSECGGYLGYNMWVSEDKECYPEPEKSEDQFGEEMEDNLYTYLYSYRYNPSLITGKVLSLEEGNKGPSTTTSTVPPEAENPTDLAGPLSYFPPNNYRIIIEEGQAYGMAKEDFMMPVLVGDVKEEEVLPTTVQQQGRVSVGGDVLEIARSFIGSPYVYGGAKVPDMSSQWGDCWSCIHRTCASACHQGSSQCSACLKAGREAWNLCSSECSGNRYCPESCRGDLSGEDCDKGCGASGFDCSGLVSYAYWKARDARMPRVSRDQYKYCMDPDSRANCFRGECNMDCYVIPIRSADDYNKLQPGDIIWYDDKKGTFSQSSDEVTCNPSRIHHVALYAGMENGKHRTYEAHSTNTGVIKGYINEDRTICGAARVTSPAAAMAAGTAAGGGSAGMPPEAGPIQGETGHHIVIKGSSYRLWLYDGQRLVEEYDIGIGSNGMGKTKQGDKKTPVGDYRIKWKASKADGTIKDGRTWCKGNDLYYGSTGPSGEKLWTDAYGGDQAAVMGLNYPNGEDREKGYTGGCIEIHASKLGGIREKSSAGCVRMNPSDANELYNRVDVGTKVRILE